jgi:thioredoxin reductase (NADPH)
MSVRLSGAGIEDFLRHRLAGEVTVGAGSAMTSAAGVEVDAGALFILIGARPHTSWLPPQVERDDWGLIMTGPDITTPAARSAPMYQTSLPGVFAVGDARHGSVKRVASAAGEGSILIPQVPHSLAQAYARTAARAGPAR